MRRRYLIVGLYLLLLLSLVAAGMLLALYFGLFNQGPPEPPPGQEAPQEEIEEEQPEVREGEGGRILTPTEASILDEITVMTANKDVPASLPLGVQEVSAEEPAFGSPTAQFSLIEYSTLGNEYARVLHADLRLLVQNSQNRVKWVMRHYPTDSEDDLRLAGLTACVFAHMGGVAFWTFIQEASALERVVIDDLLALAKSSPSFSAEVETCAYDRAFHDHIIRQVQDAQSGAQIFASPSFVLVNHHTNEMRVVDGAATIDYLQFIIDSE